jgi:hypothetical protein
MVARSLAMAVWQAKSGKMRGLKFSASDKFLLEAWRH